MEQEAERKDFLHYLLRVKDPETGARAYSDAEVRSCVSSSSPLVIVPLIFHSFYQKLPS